LKLAQVLSEAALDLAVIHVHFKELGVVQYTRDELYSVIDFIAAAGGIIGLCMGFSIISLFEVM